jgi:hypothetical protein
MTEQLKYLRLAVKNGGDEKDVSTLDKILSEREELMRVKHSYEKIKFYIENELDKCKKLLAFYDKENKSFTPASHPQIVQFVQENFNFYKDRVDIIEELLK